MSRILTLESRGRVSCFGATRDVERPVSRDGRGDRTDRRHRATLEHPGDGIRGTCPERLWEGHFGTPLPHKVNRELCLRLIDTRYELTLLPPKIRDPAAQTIPGRSIAPGEVPSITRPAGRRPCQSSVAALVRTAARRTLGDFIQPWEFGSLPRSWIGPMTERVDESGPTRRFVRDSYLASGVPADRVHVVPLGVDPRFPSRGEPLPLGTTKPFRFLFVGGTIHRKGIDVLLEAYAERSPRRPASAW